MLFCVLLSSHPAFCPDLTLSSSKVPSGVSEAHAPCAPCAVALCPWQSTCKEIQTKKPSPRHAMLAAHGIQRRASLWILCSIQKAMTGQQMPARSYIKDLFFKRPALQGICFLVFLRLKRCLGGPHNESNPRLQACL